MSAPTPAVLVPGLDGTGELFGPLIGALGPAFAPTIVRLTDQPVAWDQHVAAVEQVLLTASAPALLVAESFGGPLAVAAAARHPDRVRGVLLAATFLVRPSWSIGWIRPWYRFLVSVPWPTALRRRVLVALLAMPALDTAQVEKLLAVNNHRRASVLTHRLGQCASVDVRAEFASLRCPIAYIGGRADRIVPVARHAEMVRRLQPTATVELLPGAPHMLLQCQPDAAAAIARQLSRVDLGSGATAGGAR
jgi:sigma-B regulation protein RsbQ